MRVQKKMLKIGAVSLLVFCALALAYWAWERKPRIVSYEVDPAQGNLQMFWKNAQGQRYANFKNLKEQLAAQGKDLVFAINGGMFMKDFTPLGLYVQDGQQIQPINTRQNASGNFYMQPNGIFYWNANMQPQVVRTQDFDSKGVLFATQSGPMLVVDGQINSQFTPGSHNKKRRSGVGILANGKLLFAISKNEVDFYDFAKFFQDQGVKNALFLDGTICKMYAPAAGYAEELGDLAVMIAQVR